MASFVFLLYKASETRVQQYSIMATKASGVPVVGHPFSQ